jgi:Na+/proline symporter
MHLVDWIVMSGTLFAIVSYGVWKTRHVNTVQSFLLGDRDLPWWTIGLSIMATQASAITFLSTPGQAYFDGMRFAQFYFGLPIAMVFLSIFALPIYYRLKVYTAYEYLEGRFDLKTRVLTAFFFLVQRGLAAGLTIYAPAIILSAILGWNLTLTNLFIGAVVIFYTVAGGTKAVSVTQKQQMIVILVGMFLAAGIIVYQLPEGLQFGDAVGLAGKMGKLNVVSFEFDLSDRYNFWSGILGGVFLFLSYFGTDQSQVQRYLSGKSLTESRLGLLFNGIFKVPMQFLVLFVGILVFIFFLFVKPPLHFNSSNLEALDTSAMASYRALEEEHEQLFSERREVALNMVEALREEDEAAIDRYQAILFDYQEEEKALRQDAASLIEKNNVLAKTNDKDYVFITLVTNYLPIGLVGLLLAVIFSAAMSSTASELNALATTTVVDIYRRMLVPNQSDRHYLNASRIFTIVWGLIALTFAATADLFDNLIQAVNIIGSLFYGVILGVFVVAFFMKWVRGNAIFIAALMAEAFVLLIFWANAQGYVDIAYLWLNLIGCVLTMIFAGLLGLNNSKPPSEQISLMDQDS